MPPYGCSDKLEERKDTVGPDSRLRGLAVKEEGEKAETYRIALSVQSEV